MGLSLQDRGMVDKIIDGFVTELSKSPHPFQDQEVAKSLHVKSIEDFIFGSIYGNISGIVNAYFTFIKNRKATQEEFQEIAQITLKRLPEIREKIFFGQ